MVYICLHVHTLLLKFLAVAYQGSFRLKVPTTCGSRQTLWGCRLIFLIFLEQVIFQDGSNFDLGTSTNSATKSPQKLTEECVGVTSVNAWFSELPDDCFLFHWQVLLSPWLQLLLAYHIIVSVWLVQLALKLFTVPSVPSVSSFSSCLDTHKIGSLWRSQIGVMNVLAKQLGQTWNIPFLGQHEMMFFLSGICPCPIKRIKPLPRRLSEISSHDIQNCNLCSHSSLDFEIETIETIKGYTVTVQETL